MPVVHVSANFYWDRDDPDGSACANCGDRCYLTMWRLFVAIEKLSGPVSTKLVMCDSCHTGLMEE